MYQNIFVARSKRGSEIHIWDDQVGYQKFNYKILIMNYQIFFQLDY